MCGSQDLVQCHPNFGRPLPPTLFMRALPTQDWAFTGYLQHLSMDEQWGNGTEDACKQASCIS